ncbi:MAG: arabinofuranosyltransferase [Promethearchaeota archaeon]
MAISNSVKKTLISISKLDILQEIIFAGIGCIALIIIFPIIPKQFHFGTHSFDSIYPRIMLIALIILFLIIFLVFNQQNQKKKILKINYKRNIIFFSVFNFGISYFLFFGTDFSFFGVGMDNWWRTYYVAQMVEHGYPVDYGYKNFPPYYFPFYFYSLALYAIIFNIEPYKMIRYGALFCFYILPILIYEAWKKIYDKKISFIISVFSSVFLFDFFTINHIFTFVLIIPYFFYYYENYTKKSFTKKDYIIAGILGSILLCTYLTFFLFIPFYYIIDLLQKRSKFKEKIVHLSKISILIIIFSSWYLVPLFITFMIYGFENHLNNVFYYFFAEVPLFTHIFPFTILGFLLFIGLIYIIKNYSLSPDSRILGNILLSFYIIILIGFIGYALKTPLFLNWRLYKITKYILIIPSSIFLVRFFNFFSNHGINFKRKSILFRSSNQLKMYLIISIFCFQMYNNSMLLISFKPYENAFTEEIPDRVDIIEELDYKDKVFLTNYIEVCPFIPIYLFLIPDPHVSHPSALHNKRVEFLEELAESKTNKIFYNRIINCEFGVIDYFYLKPVNNNTEFEYIAYYDEFKNTDGVIIVFRRFLFEDTDRFEEIVIDDEIIFKTIY